MFDINAIINQAIKQAVEGVFINLRTAQDMQTQALEQMQIRLNDMTQRLEMLSASVPAVDQGDTQQLVREMAEEVVTEERFMRKLIGLMDFDDVVSNALDNIDLADKFDIEDAVKDALEDINLLDSVEDDAFTDAVKEALGEITFSLDIK